MYDYYPLSLIVLFYVVHDTSYAYDDAVIIIRYGKNVHHPIPRYTLQGRYFIASHKSIRLLVKLIVTIAQPLNFRN